MAAIARLRSKCDVVASIEAPPEPQYVGIPKLNPLIGNTDHASCLLAGKSESRGKITVHIHL